jgi:predicted ATPase
VRYARQAVAEAKAQSPVDVSYSLVYPCFVFLCSGELDTAQEMLEKVVAQPHWQGRLVWFHTEALALEGALLVRRGNFEVGVGLLRRALGAMRDVRQKNLMRGITACWLAEGLAAIGRSEDALPIIDDAIAHSPGGGEVWDAPELLRVRAHLLLTMQQPDETTAENNLTRSLERAREQSAKSWELRTTLTLARLRAKQGRHAEAQQMLSAIYTCFVEGLETPDLKTARQLLKDLSSFISARQS